MGRLSRRLICLADRLTISPTAPASARLALNPQKVIRARPNFIIKKILTLVNIFFICRRGDLNPHSSRHMHLKHACLPFHHIDMVFDYFVIILWNCYLTNTVDVPEIVFDNPLLERYSIVLVGRVPHRHGIWLFYNPTMKLSLVQYRRCAGCCLRQPSPRTILNRPRRQSTTSTWYLIIL